MAFEEYIPDRSSSRAPLASISKQGVLSFNTACARLYLKEARYARLYYDAESRQIGIKLRQEEDGHCLKLVTNKKRADHVCLFLKSLLAMHGHHPMATSMRGLSCEMNAQLDMLVVQLP